MDMLGAEMPIIQPKVRRVLYWGDRSQPLDFTTRDDTAAFTARAALDDDAPRFLRVAGATASAQDIAAEMSEVTGQSCSAQWMGPVSALSLLVRVTRSVAPQRGAVFPAWQGMQYLRDQFEGRVALHPLDNDRYPALRLTPLRTLLEQRFSTA